MLPGHGSEAEEHGTPPPAADAAALAPAWTLAPEGVTAVGRLLDEWARVCDFVVLHDLLDGDHLAIGAGGVAVVDVVTWPATRAPTGRAARRRLRVPMDELTARVARVREALRMRGVAVPVRGIVCVHGAVEPAGLGVLTRVGEHTAGPADAVARAIAEGDGCAPDSVAAAAEALRAHFVAGAAALVEVPDPSLAPISAPPSPTLKRRILRVRVQPTPLLIGAVLAVVAVAIVALALGRGSDPVTTAGAPAAVASSSGASSSADASSRLLSAADVERLIPAIRARAAGPAGGEVRGPSVKLTATEVLMRVRRGDCRMRFAIPRAVTARGVPAEVVMVVGSACPGR